MDHNVDNVNTHGGRRDKRVRGPTAAATRGVGRVDSAAESAARSQGVERPSGSAGVREVASARGVAARLPTGGSTGPASVAAGGHQRGIGGRSDGVRVVRRRGVVEPTTDADARARILSESAIPETVRMLQSCYNLAVPQEDIRAILMDAAKVSSAVYGAADAVAWAAKQGWTGIPQSAIDNDYGLFVAHGRNAQQMFRRRLKQLRPRRLNATRVTGA